MDQVHSSAADLAWFTVTYVIGLHRRASTNHKHQGTVFPTYQRLRYAYGGVWMSWVAGRFYFRRCCGMHRNSTVKSENIIAFERQTCTSRRYRHIAWILVCRCRRSVRKLTAQYLRSDLGSFNSIHTFLLGGVDCISLRCAVGYLINHQGSIGVG